MKATTRDVNDIAIIKVDGKITIGAGDQQLRDVQLVSMLDGVGDGFPDGHADPVRSIFIDARVFAEMFRDHLHELDVFESAADGDLDPLAVTFHSL